MAKKNRFGIQFEGFDDMTKKLRELEGDLKKVSEKALKESHAYVTPKIEKAIRKSKLPAKGKYSKGDTAKSIVKDNDVKWQSQIGSIKVGFNLKENLTSIFLMYGTPRMKPVSGLKNSIYGSKVQREIKALQKEIFAEEIKNKMEGKR